MTQITEKEITLFEVERFLVEEAALLDEWRLNEWVALMHPDARYLVPALDARNAEAGKSLFLVADDFITLNSRVSQLLGRSTWAEAPRSRTRRLVSNFRLLESNGPEATVTANFTIWRFQHGNSDAYVGRYVHRLVRTTDGLRFRERRVELDLEALRPHGKLSILL